ncbi:MAG: hypothetical protein HC883_06555 [Bdellovibrionaceae bacterium]|nr:hypothetical protein [Pseudobdellovibrionaceae bacterium]
MFKLIIIAVVSFSNATFAVGPGSGRANLKKTLNCEASIVASLSESHQALLQRLQTLADKFETVILTMPDFAERNLNMSLAALYTELNSLARQILERRQPRNPSELELILSGLEVQLSKALLPGSTRRQTGIPNKARMETRHFEEDWSDMSPAPQNPQLNPPPYTHSGWPNPWNWPPREKP